MSAAVLGLFVISTALYAFDVPEKATPISKEEAMKKYPPPKGGYPVAEVNTAPGQTGGFFKSPYSRHMFDCREIMKNQLILDPYAKKVFARP
jgi:hypothetical protein